MDALLTPTILDRLRTIGDPVLEAALPNTPAGVLQDAGNRIGPPDGSVLALLDQGWIEAHAADFGLGGALGGDLGLPDPPRVERACRLFALYGTEIAAALLLAALPEAYASGRGAKTLLHRSALANGGSVSTRRIAATGQFVISVMTPPDPAAPVSGAGTAYTPAALHVTLQLWRSLDAQGTSGQALRNALALRIMHALIRAAAPTRRSVGPLPADPVRQVPLNQEDLLATLLSFSVTVFETLEKLGVHWSADEEDAYFYVWDRVGAALGIGGVPVIEALTGLDPPALLAHVRALDERPGPHPAPFETAEDRAVLRAAAQHGTLRPQSVEGARVLLARLRARMWRLQNDHVAPEDPYPYEDFDEILDDLRPGRVLMRALLDEVTSRLPASQQTWPLSVVRQLVPAHVQNRLALGATTLPGLASVSLAAVGGAAGAKRLSAAALRQRATQVTASVFLSYLSEGQIHVPGVAASKLGIGRASANGAGLPRRMVRR